MRFLRVVGCLGATVVGFYWFFTSQNIFASFGGVLLGSVGLMSLVIPKTSNLASEEEEEWWNSIK